MTPRVPVAVAGNVATEDLEHGVSSQGSLGDSGGEIGEDV
jgi:hypothetical protein